MAGSPSAEVYNLYLQGPTWNIITVWDSCRDAVCVFYTRHFTRTECEPHAGLVVTSIPGSCSSNCAGLRNRSGHVQTAGAAGDSTGRVLRRRLRGAGQSDRTPRMAMGRGRPSEPAGSPIAPQLVSAHVQAAFTHLQRGNLNAAKKDRAAVPRA